MINWDEFEHIHVIKKLKQILNSWWNIDVVFTDERGLLRGDRPNEVGILQSGGRHLPQQRNVGRQASRKPCKNLSKTFAPPATASASARWEMAGFDVAIVPITIENDFMGSVVAMGFLKDRQQVSRISEIRERMAVFGASGDMIDKAISKISFVDDQDREHFVELVELVAQEIVTLHLEISSRENRIKELNKELGSRYKYDNMIGKSKPMQALYTLLDKIKTADSTVLIQGENGTGKELIAKAIHYNSNRKDKAVRDSKLFGVQRQLARVGTLRSREGIVHRRHSRQKRFVRNGRQRNILPRRDRRHVADHAGETLARLARRHVHSRRRRRIAPRGRANHRGDQPPSQRDGRARHVPRRSCTIA